MEAAMMQSDDNLGINALLLKRTKLAGIKSSKPKPKPKEQASANAPSSAGASAHTLPR